MTQKPESNRPGRWRLDFRGGDYGALIIEKQSKRRNPELKIISNKKEN